MKIRNKKFIYLISPNKIKDNSFFYYLSLVLRTNKVGFFQLRLKKETIKRKTFIAKKVQIICKKYKVKFIINDDPYFALKIKADGCHLGQKDMNIFEARKIIGDKKIIGITCHNSIKLAKISEKNKADYIALGDFNSSKTKKIKYKTSKNLLKKVRIEIAINDDYLETTIDAIVDGARTGNIGDGKIFVTDLNDCIRIRTGETGQDAIG